MHRKTAVESLSESGSFLPHSARSIENLPSPILAAKMLTELATSPCAFAPPSPGPPLALYGAGNLGRLARDFLKAVDLVPIMVIDREARRHVQASHWSDVRLVQPDEAAEAAKGELRVAVSVVTSRYVPLERSLQQLGFKDIVPFYDLAESFRDRHPLSNGWFALPLTAFDQARTAEVLAHWNDDLSRAHHLQFLAWRRLREEWDFAAGSIPDCTRFFIPEVTSTLRSDEFLLDAGAHHGSVSQAFVAQTKGLFRHIAAIEPDPANRAQLEVNLQSLLPDDLRVTIYDCALAQNDGVALFHEGLDYASQLSPTGKMKVVTFPLDALGLSPTFVKLHLEGTELAALKGSQKTLLANRPIVAATVYHNADGIWKTPLWLMQTLPDYRFLFRSHSWCGTGAVVYAIPNERVG